MPYCVCTAVPVSVRVALAAVDELADGLGGALVDVPGWAGVEVEELAGRPADGSAPPATAWPCVLKLSRATSPRTVPQIESSTRFMFVRLEGE